MQLSFTIIISDLVLVGCGEGVLDEPPMRKAIPWVRFMCKSDDHGLHGRFRHRQKQRLLGMLEEVAQSADMTSRFLERRQALVANCAPSRLLLSLIDLAFP